MPAEENDVHHLKPGLLVITLLTVATATAFAQSSEDRMRVGSGAVERDSWTGQAGGLPIRVVNPHGAIRLRQSGDDSTVEVAAVLQQLEVDGSKLALDVSVVDDTLVISILHRDLEGDLITQQSRTQLARGDLAVLIPAGTPVHAETTFGVIEARNVHSDIDLETLNGEMRVIRTVGAVTAKSKLGTIEVTLERGATRKPQRLSNENGPITVFTPPDNDLDVTMKTSGSFVTDFSLTVEHHEGKAPNKTASATLGQGGARLVMTSTSGDLGLKQVVNRH